MDLIYLDTATPEEEGRFCHFTHPAHKYPLYTGEGASPQGKLVDPDKEHHKVGATVRGWYSDTVQAVLQQNAKEDLTKDEAKQKAAGDRLAGALITAFHHVEWEGKLLTASAEDIARFRGRSPKLEKQIILFSKDDARFFTDDLPT